MWSPRTLQATLAEAKKVLPYKFHVVELYRQGEFRVVLRKAGKE